MNDLTLVSSGLLSKFGFGDGDTLWDWSYNAAEDLGVPIVIDDHAALRRLVREHLLPALTQTVVVYDIDTIHNPIRAETVDGVAIDDYADNDHIELTPAYITIPAGIVLRTIADVDEWTDEQRALIPAVVIDGEFTVHRPLELTP